MGEENKYEYWQIQNYLIFDKDQIPLTGELIYFRFTSTYAFIKNICHVIGDQPKKINQLPFIEVMIIESSIDFSLNDFRISGNTARIHNTHATNTIIVNIGTTGSPINYSINPGDMIVLKFNGINWIEQKKTGTFTLKKSIDYTIQDDEEYTSYYLSNNITLTLPVLANSQNREPFCIVNAGLNLKTIKTQTPDTINGFTKIYLYEPGDLISIFPTPSEFKICNQKIFYDSGRINTNDWTTRALGFVVLGYDNLSGTIKIGDIVTGVTSGATGKVIFNDGANVYLYQVTLGGIFTNNEILNFATGVSPPATPTATALANEPTGTNKNKDTNMYIWGMGSKIQRIDKKFIIHQADDDTAVIEKKELSFTTTPAANTIFGASYFYVGTNELAFKTGTDGLDYVSFAGTRIPIIAQDWWYRHRFQIWY